jgi:hypothetical protein
MVSARPEKATQLMNIASRSAPGAIAAIVREPEPRVGGAVFAGAGIGAAPVHGDHYRPHGEVLKHVELTGAMSSWKAQTIAARVRHGRLIVKDDHGRVVHP